MTTPAPSMCVYCRHFEPETWSCVAFPDGIPGALDLAGADHRAPLPGDHGIRFAPRSKDALEAVVEFWGPEPVRYEGPLDPEDPSVAGPSDLERETAAALEAMRAADPTWTTEVDWTA